MLIDRYINSEILLPFVSGLGLLILIFVGYTATVQLNLAAQGQLSAAAALELIALNTFVTLEVLMPSALFFSVLAAISRLHRDQEMNVLYASGISRLRILRAVFQFAVVVALITGFISIEGRPWAYREIYRLEAEAAARFDLKKMATGEFVSMGTSDYIFIADDIDLGQGLHKNVFLHKKHRGEGRTEIIVAKQAALPELNPGEARNARFYHGYHYLLDQRESQDVTVRFDYLSVDMGNSEALGNYRRKAETTAQLGKSGEPKDIAEYQWRLSTPLATLLLALLAAPLGRSDPRQPRLRSIFTAISVYVAMFGLTSVTRTFIEQGRIDTFPGLWSSYAIIFIVLLLLLRRPGTN